MIKRRTAPKWLKYAVSTALVVSILIYGFFVNEARKEVFYLCGNFASGVSMKSVTRQLDTATFSDYKVKKNGEGEAILFSSALNFRVFQCSIQFNQERVVTHAAYLGIFH
jgi:hypothetical protein